MRPQRGMSRVRAGLLAAGGVVLVVWLAFLGPPSPSDEFELRAVFRDVGGIDARSPVRIAGVEVGEAARVESLGDGARASVVTMRIDDTALPLHRDARLKVRPRLFLEGNVFVELRPGTPSVPRLEDGQTLPASQTSAPVRLGDVLSAFPAPTRTSLRHLLQGYGAALFGGPAPGEDSDQQRSVRGLTAAEALSRSLTDAPDALRATAIVSDALRGKEARDVSRLIRGSRRVATALASRETQLGDLIGRLDVTAAALAAERSSLRAAVARLPRVLGAALPALDRLDRALPQARAFAREAIPGVRELPATIGTATPWIDQARRLLSRRELRGLAADLAPAVDDLALVTDAAVPLLQRLDRVDRCALEVLLPTMNEPIADGSLSTGIANYKEFLQAMVGLTGESQNFDGNGPYTRLQPGGGAATVKTGPVPGQGPLFGNAARRPLGTRPAYPGKRPPQRTDVRCDRNRRPNLSSARTGGGP